MNSPEHPNVPAVIDCHAHLVPEAVLAELARVRQRFPGVDIIPHESTFRVAFNGGQPTRPIAAGLTDSDRRHRWLNDNGIDLQLVGGWLDIFGYELQPAEGAEWSELLTEAIVESVAADDRLVALGTVPLQDPLLAAEALKKQRTAGIPGVMMATQAGGREISDPDYAPWWEAADETRAVIFLHPGFGGASLRYQDFGLVNALGRIEDTTVTLARLLYLGIPAKYPGARIVVAHAGGSLPYVLGRLIRNHLLNPQTTADPVESFSRLYFDSVIFDQQALSFLVSRVGAERVLLGSDFPFPIGDPTPRQVISSAVLTEEERALIAGGNAHRILSNETTS